MLAKSVQLLVAGLLLLTAVIPCAGQASGPDGTYTPWLDQAIADDVVYLAMVYPSRVERFDMVQEAWLEPVETENRAQAIAAEGEYLVTAEGDEIRRYALNGGTSVLLGELDTPHELLLRGGVVIAHHGDWYTRSLATLDLHTGAPIDTLMMGLHTPAGLAMPRDLHRLYGVTAGSYPGRLVRVDFASDGTFLGHEESDPGNGPYPRPDRHYALLDGSLILTSGGQVFDGVKLESRGGSGGEVLDAAVGEGGVVILRDQTLTRLDSDFRELGLLRLAQHNDGVAVHGQKVFLFRDDWPSAPQVTSLSLSAIVSEAPPAAPNPRGEPWLADEIELDDQGVVHLHDREHSVVHHFSLASWDFTDSLALDDEALHLAVVPETGDVFVANAGGRLGHAPFGSEHTAFAVYAPWEIQHMAVADSWIYAAIDGCCNWLDHHLYTAQGDELAILSTQHHASAMRWCPQTRRLYLVPAFVSSNAIRWVELSETGQPIDNGIFGSGVAGPLRPSTDGTRLVAGSGQVFDVALGLEIENLGGPLIDMAWRDDELYTLREADGQTLIERWTADLELVQTGTLFDRAQRIMVADDRLITVAGHQGHTWIQQLSPDLTVPNVSAWLDVGPSSFVGGSDFAATAFFRHEGAGQIVEAEIFLTVDLETLPPDATWHCETASGPFECGQPGGLSEPVTLEPGDWVRVTLTSSLPEDQRFPVTVRAEILPEEPDFELADNIAEQVLTLNPVVFRDRFEP